MTKTEEKVYIQADKATSLATELLRTLEDIRYDPVGGTEEDAEALQKVFDLLDQALDHAARVGMHTGKG